MPIIEVGRQDNRQLQNIADVLATSKKVVVVTGAGISTSCGIPDFRSENGLYNLIQSQNEYASLCSKSVSGIQHLPPPKLKGKDLFSCNVWKDPISTSIFYKFISSLRQKIHNDVKQTAATHRFIRTLRDCRRLVRCYTQNIDGLETREGLITDLDRGKGNRSRFTKKSMGLPRSLASLIPGGMADGGCEVVPLHGDLESLRCNICRAVCKWETGDPKAMLSDGKNLDCQSCLAADRDRRDRGKRGTSVGSLRPNIVLYGEEHPSADVIGTMTTHDLALAPDVLLILGTSLHVHGLKVLVKEFAKAVHARVGGKGTVVLVNLTKPAESMWKEVIDYWVPMECDAWVDSLRRHRPDLWHVQGELNGAALKGSKRTPFIKNKTSVADEDENKSTDPITASISKPIHRRSKAMFHRSSPSTMTPITSVNLQLPLTPPKVISQDRTPNILNPITGSSSRNIRPPFTAKPQRSQPNLLHYNTKAGSYPLHPSPHANFQRPSSCVVNSTSVSSSKPRRLSPPGPFRPPLTNLLNPPTTTAPIPAPPNPKSEPTQLPTPPPTGRRSHFQPPSSSSPSRKRKILDMATDAITEDGIPSTPSKRARKGLRGGVAIWRD